MFSFLRAFPRATAPVLAALALLLSSTGGSVLASNTGVAPVLVPYTVNVLAGNSQSSISGYSGEGVLATNATLSGPNALAVDSVGNVYIADQSKLIANHLTDSARAGPQPMNFPGAEEASLFFVRHTPANSPKMLHAQTYVRQGRWVGIITLTTRESELQAVRADYDAFVKGLRITPA